MNANRVGLAATRLDQPVDEALLLQRGEEALHDGVVPAVPTRLVLAVNPAPASSCRYTALAYCTARNECVVQRRYHTVAIRSYASAPTSASVYAPISDAAFLTQRREQSECADWGTL